VFLGRHLCRVSVLTAAATLGVVSQALKPANATEDTGCQAYDGEYNVVASLIIKNTPFGAANGQYQLGTGKLTLRTEGQTGREAVKLMAYDLANRFTVVRTFVENIATLASLRVNGLNTSAVGVSCNGLVPLGGATAEVLVQGWRGA
jgi:hypothetical protein